MVVVWFEAFEWCKEESSSWAEVSLYCTHAAEAGSFQAVISPDPRTDAKPEVAWWRTSLALIVCNYLLSVLLSHAWCPATNGLHGSRGLPMNIMVVICLGNIGIISYY